MGTVPVWSRISASASKITGCTAVPPMSCLTPPLLRIRRTFWNDRTEPFSKETGCVNRPGPICIENNGLYRRTSDELPHAAVVANPTDILERPDGALFKGDRLREQARPDRHPSAIGAENAARGVAFQDHRADHERAALIENGARLEDFVGGAAIEHLELGFGEADAIYAPLAETAETVTGEVRVLQGNEAGELKVQRDHQLRRRDAGQLRTVRQQICQSEEHTS